MPTAILDPNRNTVKSPLIRGILNEVSVNPASTSILGPKMVDPDVLVAMKKLAYELPGNIKEQATNRVKAMVHRLMAEHGSGLQAVERRNLMERVASDPVANVLVQNDIAVRPMVGRSGEYAPAFWTPDRYQETVDAVIGESRAGIDDVQKYLRGKRNFTYGSPDAIGLDAEKLRTHPRKVLNEVLPHEANHASQDRFGVSVDKNLDTYQHGWAGNPTEWESEYAGKIGDPALARDITSMLSSGQKIAMNHTRDASQMGESTWLPFVGQLNQRLLRSNPNAKLLDMIPNGKLWSSAVVANPNEMRQPELKNLMKAILGQ